MTLKGLIGCWTMSGKFQRDWKNFGQKCREIGRILDRYRQIRRIWKDSLDNERIWKDW